MCLIANSFYGSKNSLVQQTGFKTILLEPLFDVEKYLEGEQSKNFDIMLHNSTTKHTIFIEVKTGISSIKELLDNFEESKNILKEKFDQELSKIINLKLEDHNHVDFVLLLPREQSLEVKERIFKEGVTNIILWELSTITNPPIEVRHDITCDIQEMLKKNQTHSNNTFRKQIYDGLKLKPPIKIFNFLLNSDPHQKLTYFTTLLKNMDLRKFNFKEVKNRILDGEMSFSAYLNSEQSKEFIYREIVKNLKKIGALKIITQTDNVLTDEYELTIDKRGSENIFRNKISNCFFENYIKEKENEIKQEALNRHLKYHGQNTL